MGYENIPVGNPFPQFNSDNNTWEPIMRVGSTNIFYNTGLDNPESSTLNFGEILSSLTVEDNPFAISGKTLLATSNPEIEKDSSFGFLQTMSLGRLKSNTVYTLSFMGKLESEASLSCMIGTTEITSETLTTDYQLKEIYFITPKIESDIDIKIVTKSPNIIYISDLKLEEGNIATSWNRSPLDVTIGSGAFDSDYVQVEIPIEEPDISISYDDYVLGMPPGNITGLSLTAGDKQIAISWTDPDDSYIIDSEDDRKIISVWAGTRVIKKANSLPKDKDDGIFVVDCTSRNDYRVNPYIDTDVENGTLYYYAAFPYTEKSVFNMNIKYNSGCCTPLSKATIYGVSISAQSSATPSGSPTYTYENDASSFTKASIADSVIDYGSWKSIIDNEICTGICTFKNGKVNYYLDPNNLNKRIDGTNADITSGKDGDVMVEFNHMNYTISGSDNNLSFRISSMGGSGFVDTAFKGHRKMYVSAFECCVLDDRLRSIKGYKPAMVQPSNISSYLQNGYSIINIEQFMYILLLKIMILQHRGLTGSSSFRSSKPLKSGDSIGKIENKYGEISLFGIENFMTNTQSYINGKSIPSANLPIEVEAYADSIGAVSNESIGLLPTYSSNASNLYLKYRRGLTASKSTVLSIGLNYTGFTSLTNSDETSLLFSQIEPSIMSDAIGYRMVYLA